MLVLLTDGSDIAARARDLLGGGFRIREVTIDRPVPLLAEPVEGWIFAADLEQAGTVSAGIRHLRHRELEQPLVVIAARRDIRVQARADALGATRVYELANTAALLRDPLFANGRLRVRSAFQNDPAVMAAISLAVGVITETMSGRATTSASEELNAAVDAAVDAIQRTSVAAWLKALEEVHAPTYRHTLQVLALSVAFGTVTGLPYGLLQKLGVAALLHDIGKAKLPADLLGRAELPRREEDMLESHPKLGFDMLRAFGERDVDVLDAVLHHHELMDGTGFPHRLKGAQIRPLTRMLTIANTYARFIDPLPPLKPLTRQQALRGLQARGPKLDVGLVATFRKVVR